MRIVLTSLTMFFLLTAALAQEKKEEPADEKALKTYEKALKSLHEHKTEFALDDFKKADKQDGGHCLGCQKQMIKLGRQLGEWKTAELGAEEMAAQVQGPKDTAIAHYQLAVVLFEEGLQKHKEEVFARSHGRLGRAGSAASRSFTRSY